MAGRGRCAGCGLEGSVCKVSAHILECSDYAAVYRADPQAALGPAAALAAWKNGLQQEAKQQHRAAAIADHAQRRSAQSSRFTRLPDPLAESNDEQEGHLVQGPALAGVHRG